MPDVGRQTTDEEAAERWERDHPDGVITPEELAMMDDHIADQSGATA